ncbi:MAG: hypothetical protein Q8P99_01910, partial [bacterium]|nr:hypothetical protein [bacterium]
RWLLFGPIAMFFIFLAIKVSTELNLVNPYGAKFAFPNGGGGIMALMASSIGDMFIVIGMLVGGLYTANKMGIAGSKIFYGSMIKARSWVGKQVKKGALALPKKYGKMGLEKAKDVAKAQKLSFTSDRLQTDKAQQRTKDLAASKSRLARFAGRRRMGKSQAAQSFLKDREKQRLFMHKDAKGEWKDNAPYLNSQIVAGLLKDPEANENALAVAYELMGEGKILPFETDAQGLLAYAANSPGFIDRHNLQKAENALAKIGYSNAAMAVVASGGDRAGVRAALNKKLGPRSVVRFDPDTQNAPNKETAGQTLAQKRVYLNGVNDFLTIDRSDQLAQNFGTFDGERKMDVLKASSEVVEEMGGLMGGVIQGFSGLTPEQQMQHFDGLTALNLSNIRAAATSGSALHEAIRGVDTSSAEGQAQLRRTLRTIYSNNSNLIGNTSTLGAYLGGIPPAPSP